MAKSKGEKKETKSEFLRKALTKDNSLEYEQVLRKWIKTGHEGTISSPLYYKVRADLGIRTVWEWVQTSPPTIKLPAAPEPTGDVYQFKITLQGSKPPIWRRIQVRDSTLDAFHFHIQAAMGWTNSHLHQFRIGELHYGEPEFLADGLDESEYESSFEVKLSDVLTEKGMKFYYEYDFGDDWLHEILFEGAQPVKADQTYPVCLQGARACPPEDVGGIWGYADFLTAIADKKHPEHASMLEWAGGKFVPEAFNADAVTRQMRIGLPNWRVEF